MNVNSLEAYATVDLTKSERATMEILAKYGPASQAELIKACCEQEPSFLAMEDAQRVKAGQNLYARLHGLKKAGYAIITGTKPDPWTRNTVDVYAVNPAPPVAVVSKKAPSLKVLLSRIEEMEERLHGLGKSAVSAEGVVIMLQRLRLP